MKKTKIVIGALILVSLFTVNSFAANKAKEQIKSFSSGVSSDLANVLQAEKNNIEQKNMVAGVDSITNTNGKVYKEKEKFTLNEEEKKTFRILLPQKVQDAAIRLANGGKPDINTAMYRNDSVSPSWSDNTPFNCTYVNFDAKINFPYVDLTIKQSGINYRVIEGYLYSYEGSYEGDTVYYIAIHYEIGTDSWLPGFPITGYHVIGWKYKPVDRQYIRWAFE